MFSEEDIKKAMPEDTANLFLHGFSTLDHIRRWTLVGGTALSIHYKHRLSEDLDFFIGADTLEGEVSSIAQMMQTLKKKGLICKLNFKDNEQRDYEVNGVKITFHASGLRKLKEGTLSFANINIASIDTIVAMKLSVLLHHRIKTRDFYDIKELIVQKESSLFSLLDIYNSSDNKKEVLGERYILDRFTQTPLCPNDEGLQDMDATGISTFAKLRAWFAEAITRETLEDDRVLVAIAKDNEDLPKYAHRHFGLSRLSLAQKYATLGKDDMVEKCLELSFFDLSYRDIAARHLLSYYEDDVKMYKKVLRYAEVIPLELMEVNQKFLTEHQRKNLQLLKLEHSINGCAKTHCTEERMKTKTENFDIGYEEYVIRVEEKRARLK